MFGEGSKVIPTNLKRFDFEKRPSLHHYIFTVCADACLKDKMLSYRRETALQGTLVLAESGRLELRDNILLILSVWLQPL